jgi:hypothetical protein
MRRRRVQSRVWRGPREISLGNSPDRYILLACGWTRDATIASRAHVFPPRIGE